MASGGSLRDAVFLSSNGRIGIGTLSPAHTLDVAGSGLTDDVVVTCSAATCTLPVAVRVQTAEGTATAIVNSTSSASAQFKSNVSASGTISATASGDAQLVLTSGSSSSRLRHVNRSLQLLANNDVIVDIAHATGTTRFAKDVLVGNNTGTSAVHVSSVNGDAEVSVEGYTSAAMMLSAPTGSTSQFQFGDGSGATVLGYQSGDLFLDSGGTRLASLSSKTGNLKIAGAVSSVAGVVNINATTGAAQLSAHSVSQQALLEISSPTVATLSLATGTEKVDFSHTAEGLTIGTEASTWVTISDEVSLANSLVIGNSTGPRTFELISNASALLNISSGENSEALLSAHTSGSGIPSLELTSGTSRNGWSLRANTSSNTLSLQHISSSALRKNVTWLQIGADTDTIFKGPVHVQDKLSIGTLDQLNSSSLDLRSSGTASASILAANASIILNATSSDAIVELKAPSGYNSLLRLKSAEVTYQIKAEASNNDLILTRDNQTVLKVSQAIVDIAGGLKVRDSASQALDVSPHGTVGVQQLSDPKIALSVTGDVKVEADASLAQIVYVDKQNQRVGMNEPNPSEALDVTGDLKIIAANDGSKGALDLEGTLHAGYMSHDSNNRAICLKVGGQNQIVQAVGQSCANSSFVITEDSGTFTAGQTITGSSLLNVTVSSGAFAANDLLTGSSTFVILTTTNVSFEANDVITGSSSSATATVVLAHNTSLLVVSSSGDFIPNEAITATGSSAVGTFVSSNTPATALVLTVSGASLVVRNVNGVFGANEVVSAPAESGAIGTFLSSTTPATAVVVRRVSSTSLIVRDVVGAFSPTEKFSVVSPSGAVGSFTNDLTNGGCGSTGWCTSRGIANYFLAASSTDVYLPSANASDSDVTIVFKRTSALDTPQSFYLVGKGDDWSGTYPAPAHLNVASEDLLTGDGDDTLKPKLEFQMPANRSQLFVSLHWDNSLWRAWSWLGD